jgi:hypothetical protein
MAKPVAGDTNSIFYSEGTTCTSWLKVPVDLIDSVEVLSEVPCKDHTHPLVRLHFRSPSVENKEATLLHELLKRSSDRLEKITSGGSALQRFSLLPSSTASEATAKGRIFAKPTDETGSHLSAALARHTTKDQLSEFSLLARSKEVTEVPTVPTAIATILTEEYGIDQVTGSVECAAAIQGVLDNYDTCVGNGGSPDGCARNAARQIRNYACRSYCDCQQ